VADAPDPLGKRALFWAPAERDEEGPRYLDEDDVPGKHALYSEAPAARAPGRGGRRRTSESGSPWSSKDGHPSNRRSGHDRRAPLSEVESAGANRAVASPDELERPVGSGMFGSLVLHCSSCRVRSQVDLVEYFVLHMPVWLWRPGRGYTRFMMCPACRRRTWISASWTSWSR
jgi:hypothetical protein